MNRSMRHTEGFTLISALFVVVVVASLAVYLATLSTAQHTSSALSVRASQAMYIAQSGIDWVAYRLAQGDSCAAIPSLLSVDGYDLAIENCTTQTVSEGGASYPLHAIAVNASIGTYGESGFVSRRLSVTLAGS